MYESVGSIWITGQVGYYKLVTLSLYFNLFHLSGTSPASLAPSCERTTRRNLLTIRVKTNLNCKCIIEEISKLLIKKCHGYITIVNKILLRQQLFYSFNNFVIDDIKQIVVFNEYKNSFVLLSSFGRLCWLSFILIYCYRQLLNISVKFVNHYTFV